MSYSVEKMSVVEKEGIEFYVNADGSKSGMSQRGLARFCGVGRTTLHSLLDRLDKLDIKVVGKEATNSAETTEYQAVEGGRGSIHQCLLPYAGQVYLRNVEAPNSAKIIDSQVCEAAIFYYSFINPDISREVKHKASYSYRKFAQIGLHEWIKKTVGVIEKHDTDELKALMGQILCKMDSLEKVTTEYKAIREKTTVHYVGMDQLLTDLQKEQNNLLEPTEDGSLSLEGYLHKNGITLSRSKFKSLAIMVGQSYKSLTGTEPNKAHFSVNGKKKYNVFVYKPIYFPMLNMCLTKVIAGQF